VLAVYVTWVWQRPRVVGREGWSVTLPDGPLTLLQIGIGIIDLCFCAAPRCTCCARRPNIGFVTLAVIFVAATLLGFASHAPGGLGVFDAAMLVALWQFDKEPARRPAAVPIALLHRSVSCFRSSSSAAASSCWRCAARRRRDPRPASLAPTDVSSPTAPARGERSEVG